MYNDHTLSFLIQCDEFSKVRRVNSLRILSEGVLVIWEWKFPDAADEDVNSVCSAEEDDSETCDSNDEDQDELLETDTVVFKCIGVTKDPLYQDTLTKAATMLREGRDVSARTTPAPTNPFDAHAILFECNVGSGWKAIGYVVKELCTDVQEALNTNMFC